MPDTDASLPRRRHALPALNCLLFLSLFLPWYEQVGQTSKLGFHLMAGELDMHTELAAWAGWLVVASLIVSTTVAVKERHSIATLTATAVFFPITIILLLAFTTSVDAPYGVAGNVSGVG